MAGIHDNIPLISHTSLEAIQNLRKNILNQDRASLNCEEILAALIISAVTNPSAEIAAGYLQELAGCRAHCTAILSDKDELLLNSLGLDVTCDPEYVTTNLYFG